MTFQGSSDHVQVQLPAPRFRRKQPVARLLKIFYSKSQEEWTMDRTLSGHSLKKNTRKGFSEWDFPLLLA